MLTMERKRKIPEWLMSMINAEFNTTQKHDENEKGYFCIECGGESISEKEKRKLHEDHKVLKAYNTSRKYGYRAKDIYGLGSNVLDVSGIRPFSINNGHVFFPKSRSNKDFHMKNKGLAGNCFGCGYKVDKPYLFCSIHCKVRCETVKEELNTMETIMKQENVGADLLKNVSDTSKSVGADLSLGVSDTSKAINKPGSFRKRSRKGIPHRAPLF